MSTERYIAGSAQGLNWVSAISGSKLNNLPIGNSILSDIQIDNSVALDMYADLVMFFDSATYAAGTICRVSLYPLNQDGTTYGDGQFSAAASGYPTADYLSGTIFQNNITGSVQGMLRGILLPPGKFKFVFSAGSTSFPNTNNSTAYYRTYNRQVA